ncbi:cytochrome C oxidase subunit IV family protein [Gordonia aichiensis]|uniref:Cytochrome c oxidase subunit IV n=1 Tax=Gordonia aichiensis NBRC 108223 TaxID=1220583 RepID=L7KJY6_9ACTN|nr:cytochrome C oxidase subunit IV family protein [Gordonia aichiensis]GAC49190.1 hypothetical protein GOACH_10_01580 [Gordonia aichiensis NBRC 108223]
MPGILKQRTTVVWIFLMLATVVTTWWLAKDAFPVRVGTVGIFLIAAVKVHLVLNEFMELRQAPKSARIVFETWVVLVTAGVVGIYLAT